MATDPAIAELKLIDGVELKLALASDVQFVKLVNIYLCPLLLKLASPYARSRDKMQSLLSMIDNRTAGITFEFPTKALVAQYKDAKVPSLVKETTLRYLSRSLGNGQIDHDTLPVLMSGYSEASMAQQSILFNIICRTLTTWIVPDSTAQEDHLVQIYKIDADRDQRQLAKHFLDMMFLNMGYFKEEGAQSTQGASSSLIRAPDPSEVEASEVRRMNLHKLSMAGLQEHEIKFLTPEGASTYTVATLNTIKLGILRFIALKVMKDELRHTVALVASFDLKSEIQNHAGTVIRRCEVLDSDEYAQALFELLLSRKNLSQQLQIRVFQLLSKSIAAVKQEESALALIAYGIESERPKIRSACIGFLQWYARFAPSSVNTGITPRLLSQISRFLNSPEITDDAKGSAYVAMGYLVKVNLYSMNDANRDSTLFTALAFEKPLRTAIEEALSSLVHVYHGAAPEQLAELDAILLDVILNKPIHTHYTALRFCQATFEFSDAGARWLCMLSTSKSHPKEVKNEAHKGLDLYRFRSTEDHSSSPPGYPTVETLMAWPGRHLGPGDSLFTLDDDVLVSFTRFTRAALYSSVLGSNGSIPDLSKTEGYEDLLHETLIQDIPTRQIVTAYLRNEAASEAENEFTGSIDSFQEFVTEFLFRTQNDLSISTTYEFLVLRPQCAKRLITRLPVLRASLTSANGSNEYLLTSIYAITATCEDNPIENVETELKDLVGVVRSGTDAAGISVLLISELLIRLEIRGRFIQPAEEDLAIVQDYLCDHIDDKNLSVRRFSLKAIANVALTKGLNHRKTLADALLEQLNKKTSPSSEQSGLQELVYIALGHLSLHMQSESDDLKAIVAALIADTGETLKIDLLLASGEALATCLGQWQSSGLQGRLDVPSKNTGSRDNIRDELAISVVDQLLEFTKSPRPTVRKGACIRLISLVQLLHMSVIKERFSLMHAAFLGLLGDKDDFIVESANKGIQLIYQKSEKGQKDALVAQLLSTMMSDSAAKQASNPSGISADTEIFTPGTMSVGSGTSETSVSTYKDICNLAVDAGNSSLIYSFLSLASSSSMWSTRRGAALGLNSLLSSDIGKDVGIRSPEMLRRLLPKLYRYKYDPSSKVAASMNGIFQQLYPNVKETLDREFVLVLNELLKCLGDSSWRVRESATAALTNLLTGRSSLQLIDHVEEIWTLAFRVLDDVKESVRIAAVVLCKSLANRAIKQAESTNDASHGLENSLLSSIIPLFLRNLKSSSAEVSAFALKTLLKITKTAGKSIRNQLPILIEEFLLLTSTMEPEVMNYLGFHASKYNLSQSDLDNHRLASMRTSPLLDALEQCVDQLDEDSAREALPRVCHIIRQTNGLPTRAALSRFLISASSRNAEVMRPHADNVLQALSTTLQDRNETVVSLSASAVGYLARLASDDKLTKLVDFLLRKYLEAEDHNNALGLTFKAISQNANDRFNSMGDVFLPISYFAMHDGDAAAAKVFKQIFEDNAGASGAVKLYLSEIMSLVEANIQSPIWAVKQIAAKTIAGVATTTDLGPNMERVLTLVVNALNGKSWSGKEDILKAYVALIKRSSTTLADARMEEARRIFLREVKRTNVEYKRHALLHYANFLEHDTRHNAFQEVLDLVEDTLTGAEMDVDYEDEVNPAAAATPNSDLKTLVFENSLRCLFSAFDPSHDAQSREHFAKLVDIAAQVVTSATFTTKLLLCSCLGTLFTSSLDVAKSGERASFLTGASSLALWSTVLERMSNDAGFATLREQSAKTTKLFFESLRAHTESEPGDASLRDAQRDIATKIRALIAGEQSTIVQGVLKKICP